MSDNQVVFPPHSLNTAVLFLIFNRLDVTRQVFDTIRQSNPPRLYIAGDGPRKSLPVEDKKVKAVRDYIMSNIDWECKVKTLFREKNLGCKYAVSRAINWFFENEEMGIILEDDCLPNQSFFWFCEMMLERYRNDTKIMMISGANYLFGKIPIIESYFFSRYYSIWGWATWRRAWNMYDINMNSWHEYRNNGELTLFLREKEIIEYYTNMFQTAYSKRIDTWDIQWVYACIFNKGLSIVPVKNLVSNIGITGTHTGHKPSVFINMPTKLLDINNIKHPLSVTPNILCDRIAYYNILSNRNKLKYYIAKFLNRIKIYNYISRLYRKLKTI